MDLSSFYLDVLKDRLYAESPDGPDRRAARFVLARLLDVLARLLAPVLPHTAEEVWDFLPAAPGKAPSVHLADWPTPDPAFDDPGRDARWADLRALRETVLVALEGMRKSKQIGSSQEASVTIHADFDTASRLDADLLATLCIVSEVEFLPDSPPPGAPTVTARKSDHPKCERCWNLRPTVGHAPDHRTLCARCARVVAGLKP